MRNLFVWDFDWSLINTNSDPWVIERIGASKIFERLLQKRKEIGWTKVIDQTLKEAHEEFQYTKEDLKQACSSVPIDPTLLQVIKHLDESPNNSFVICSDANSVFIDTILKHHYLNETFKAVYTNDGWYDKEGALRVKAYCKEAHSCTLCPSNLCKGQVLEDILTKQKHDRTIYIGDGSGDFCPCTRLHPEDIIFARTNYPNETTKTPLIAKLEQAGFTRQPTKVVPPKQSETSVSAMYPLLYGWENQAILATMLSLL